MAIFEACKVARAAKLQPVSSTNHMAALQPQWLKTVSVARRNFLRLLGAFAVLCGS